MLQSKNANLLPMTFIERFTFQVQEIAPLLLKLFPHHAKLTKLALFHHVIVIQFRFDKYIMILCHSNPIWINGLLIIEACKTQPKKTV